MWSESRYFGLGERLVTRVQNSFRIGGQVKMGVLAIRLWSHFRDRLIVSVSMVSEDEEDEVRKKTSIRAASGSELY